MKHEFRDIYHVLNIPQWEELQEHLAIISKTAIITIDYKGVPVTRHSRCCSFCRSVRDDPFLSKICQTCDSRGGLEAVRSQKPYIYLCHFNIVDFAVPIIVDDKYIGAIMAGQVRLSNAADCEGLERILYSQKNYAANQHLKEHYKEYMEIPEMPLKEIETFAQMLFSLYNYIVNNTACHPSILVYRPQPQAQAEDYSESYHLRRRKPHVGSHMLKPALDLLANKAYHHSQKEMADLCHISPSYFSRLFIKETGQSYSQYVTRMKLGAAKQLLEQTNYPIAQISEDLDFSSPCYFSKVFKKMEGTTPNLYRKYYRDADNIIHET